jgi:hypothetical protein
VVLVVALGVAPMVLVVRALGQRVLVELVALLLVVGVVVPGVLVEMRLRLLPRTQAVVAVVAHLALVALAALAIA